MKKFKKAFVIFSLMMSLIFAGSILSTPVTAHATDLSGAVNDIKNSGGGALGDDAKNKVTSLSKDSMDIVGVVVMAIVTISGIWCGVKFAGSGDNPQKKAILKGAIVLHVLGLIFLANYFGFVDFAFKNFKIFN